METKQRALIALVVFACLIAFLAPAPAAADLVVGGPLAGNGPIAVAVNPVTNKIYVANQGSDDVTVIDGATNAVDATVPAGDQPYAIAVNPTTNKIYVSASGNHDNLTVIDGATNAATVLTVGAWPRGLAVNPITNKIYVANAAVGSVTVIDGASDTMTTLPAGGQPSSVAVNPVTNKIYVANETSANVTVIKGATDIDAATVATTVNTGSTPYAVAVNPVTNKIYVANKDSANVTVIDGATNGTATVAAGTSPYALAVNPVTNRIYVANGGTYGQTSTVTIIDGATAAVAATVTAGIYPHAVSVNAATNKIYVANEGSNDVTVIDGAHNDDATTTTVKAGLRPVAVVGNPVTNRIYVANYGSSTVTVVDGSTNAWTSVPIGLRAIDVAVNPATNKIYVANESGGSVTVVDGATRSSVTVPAAPGPTAVAVNPVTNKIYAVGATESANVTVIDGATNATATLTAGGYPWALAVNPVTNKIYVSNSLTNNVTVIDGATNDTTNLPVNGLPAGIAVNPVTNKIYVGIEGGSVAVIDGATERVATTVTVPGRPYSIAANPVTNKIYAASSGNDGGVAVIDGATDTVVTVAGAPASTSLQAVAVNSVTNKIYLAGMDLMVIDGATNQSTRLAGSGNFRAVAVDAATNKIYATAPDSRCIMVIDGASNGTTLQATGDGSWALAVNPATGQVYVANYYSYDLAIITPAPAQALPLEVNIAPLQGNSTTDTTPSFTFSAAGSFGPSLPPQNVWYQVDTLTGSWLKASPSGSNWTGDAPALLAGEHTLYAMASDGQDATSTNAGQGSSPVLGQISAYTFLVAPQYDTTTTLTSSSNPSLFGRSVTFTAIVKSVESASSPTPTGTVTFYEVLGSGTPGARSADGLAPAAGAESLEAASVDEVTGEATFTWTSSALTAGSHTIYAVYNGDAQYKGSTSNTITQVVNALAGTTTVLTSATNPSSYRQKVTFTAKVSSTSMPTGSVTFYENPAGDITVSAQQAAAASEPAALLAASNVVQLDANGQAVFSTSTLAPGLHSLVAVYSGDPDHSGSTSNTIEQIVYSKPVVDENPVDQTVVAGQTATFTARAIAYPEATVQWQVSSNGTSWNNIDGATTTTYSFTADKSQNGYQYRAVFVNGRGATSLPATLTVYWPPEITAQPADQTVIAGQQGSFTAAASGNPAPTVQWQESADGGSHWSDIAGATSTTYAFTPALSQNGRQYRAVFANSAGTATSNAAKVSVVLVGRIEGIVYNDANGDGRFANEIGLAGIRVELKQIDGTLIATTPSAADGTYAFTGLAGGAYRVRLDVPAGYLQTTPMPADIDLRDSQTVSGVDFGAVRPADLRIAMTASVSGKQIIYTIAVTNYGSAEALAAQLTDALPTGTAFASVTTTLGTCTGTKTVTCSFGNLASGSGATVTLKVNRTTTKSITNTARVSSGTYDPYPSDNTATLTVQ